MARNEMKAWRCPQKHILGQVMRNGSGIRRLLLYRHPVNDSLPLPTPDVMEDVDVMAVIDGLVLDVKCEICGSLRTWEPGEESMRQLLRHFIPPDKKENTSDG